MKKNKLIGIGIATFGVLLSFGSAIALYQQPVANVGFGIGAATYTSSNGVVTYTIGGVANKTVNPTFWRKNATNGGTKFDEEFRHAKYEFQLGASFAEGITAQDYIMGNLSVSLTGVPAALQSKVDVSMYFDGYGSGTLGQVVFGSNLTSESSSINNTVISGASLTVDARDICVSSGGSQTFVVYFRLDDSVDTLTMDELANCWTLSVTWAAPADYDQAYMANNKVEWAEDDEFVMAPNINKGSYVNPETDFEWWGQIKGSATLTEAKCRQGDNWENIVGNHELEADVTYNVSWDGKTTSAATFAERA